MITSFTPAVYKLGYSRDQGYYLAPHKPVFTIIGKNYGDIDKHVNIFWNRFVSGNNSMGVMLTGSAGSGKTRVAEILGNLGINNGMCVVLVTDIEISIELIPFIDNLHNMVIVFDEFSKNFALKLQDKMLTMFSSIGPFKKLFILTENNRTTISPYIRTRPGRIRYAVDYDRIKDYVIADYCNDHNVDDGFRDDIFDLYAKAPKFTFDHLQALVGEKEANSTMSMTELLDILNLDDLTVPDSWGISKAINIETKEEYVDTTSRDTVRTKDELITPYLRIWLELTPKSASNKTKNDVNDFSSPSTDTMVVRLLITSKDLSRIENQDTYIFIKDGIEMHFNKINMNI